MFVLNEIKNINLKYIFLIFVYFVKKNKILYKVDIEDVEEIKKFF